jgi:hypothetical protein
LDIVFSLFRSLRVPTARAARIRSARAETVVDAPLRRFEQHLPRHRMLR